MRAIFPGCWGVSEGAESIEHRAKRIGKQLQFFTVACYLLLAAFYHLITLSACQQLGGIARPIYLAVLR